MKDEKTIEEIITKWHCYITALNAKGTLDYSNTIAVIEKIEEELKIKLNAIEKPIAYIDKDGVFWAEQKYWDNLNLIKSRRLNK